MPVGSPVCVSIMISPPGGTSLSAVTPASSSALLLAQTEWKSISRSTIGRSGNDGVEIFLGRQLVLAERVIPPAAGDPSSLGQARVGRGD